MSTAESPSYIVDGALYSLRMAIKDLKEYRLANYTADQVLASHELISSCAADLDGLAGDIRKAVFKDMAA